MAESRGIDIIRSGDTSILFVASLFDAANSKITSGTTSLRLWHLVPGTGDVETYDFDDDTFKTTAVTTATASMTHETAENGTYNTGIWQLRHATLTAFTSGDKYVAEVSHADLAREIHVLFQYGDTEGDLVSLVNAECDTAISDASLATAAALTTVDTVVDAIKALLDTTAMAERSSGAPPATPAGMIEALSYLYMNWRNANTSTSSARALKDDAGTTIASATLSDDGTTFDQGKMGAP